MLISWIGAQVARVGAEHRSQLHGTSSLNALRAYASRAIDTHAHLHIDMLAYLYIHIYVYIHIHIHIHIHIQTYIYVIIYITYIYRISYIKPYLTHQRYVKIPPPGLEPGSLG